MPNSILQPLKWRGNENGYLQFIDQTALPLKKIYISCHNEAILYSAIRSLKVRGAPLIGVAGAFGVCLIAKNIRTPNPTGFLKELRLKSERLASARPTAVNLSWAIKRMLAVAQKGSFRNAAALKESLLIEAKRILSEDIAMCEAIGRYGSKLIKNNSNILTHCNAGTLATGRFGTALSAIYAAKQQGKKIHVYVDETRPLLQGARLTAWELTQAGINCTLICDNMAGPLMAQGKIDCVIVGADRIARNGDTANKTGTYGLSVLAKAHKIPFYVAAPVSTFDLKTKSGRDIVIEHREEKEVLEFAGRRTAPKEMKAYNPAFDVTPAKFITAFITNNGIRRQIKTKI
ncbi:MAG: S-methyl-5-thioribose-1-phosphate isomerase [Planctomycetes bacterium]|nr:S-methyl-5-thioribose-1-phosphate isomerase [Planctomycetota bacterium]